MTARKRKSSFSFRFNKDIGIDLGTANTLVFLRGKGVIIKEPSVVAIDSRSGQMLSVGSEARAMIGRTPEDIKVIRPLKNGVIADFNITCLMLKYFISKALKGTGVVKPRVLVGIPLGITQVEKRAVLEAVRQAGAREAYVIEEPVAAAIGAGLPVCDPRGSLVIDVGGGTSEVALLSLGGVVVGKSLRAGGDEMNQSIIRYIRKTYNIDIGENSAENAKIEAGYATDAPENRKHLLKGRNLATGLPNSIEISASELSDALRDSMQTILEAVRATLEQTPPELATDIIDHGMMLTGGGALLKNLDLFLSRETKTPVHVADDPLTCVARGTGIALEEIQLLRKLIVS